MIGTRGKAQGRRDRRSEVEGQGLGAWEDLATEPRLPRSPSRAARQRRARVVTLVVLMSALLAAVLAFALYMRETQRGAAAKPLPMLSTISQAMPPHFLFSINGVSRPLGVAVSPAGDRIYVTESDGARETKVFDRDGQPVGALNPPGSQPTTRTPVYVAVGPQGKVYVSDRQMGTVHVYSPEGSYLGRVDPPEGANSPWAPLALGFDLQGGLLATDVAQGRHGVVVFDPDGNFLRRFGREGSGEGGFSYPNGVAVDRDGHILVSDSNNGRIISFDAAGTRLWALGRGGVAAGMGLPRGLVVDERNRMHVADTTNHVVLVFQLAEQEAKLLFTIGGEGIKDGQFSFPNGLALDRGDRLYVTDRENNRVQVATY